MKSIETTNEFEMLALGRALSGLLKAPLVIGLQGDLGAGKTTLVRGLLHALGYAGHVKSPTFTFVEPYELAQWNIYHFDLYRLPNPEALEAIGWREYFNEDAICIIEWPNKAGESLPELDLLCHFTIQAAHRIIDFSSPSGQADGIIEKLSNVSNG